MAIYAGETVRVFATTLDWEDSQVTPSNGVASVVIYDENGREVALGPMTWVNARGRWEYDWKPVYAGTYVVEVTSLMNDGDVAKEIRRVSVESTRPRPSRDTERFYRLRDVIVAPEVTPEG